MEPLYENIKKLRKQRELSQDELARLTGYTDRSSISKIEKGEVDLPQSKIYLFAKALGTTMSELVGWSPSPAPTAAASWPRIPVYGRVTAGESRPVFADFVEDVAIDPEIYDRYGAELKGVKVSGNSMAPRICDGDTLIIHPQPDAESGEVVIVTTNGDDAMCKRLKKYTDGIQLISDNPAYPPMTFSAAELESLPVTIIGKVVRFIGEM